MPSPQRKKSARKGAKKSARKTKRSYRFDPPEQSVRLLEAIPRRDDEKVRKERVKKLIQNATLGYAISANDFKFLTPEEKQIINSISRMFMCAGKSC